MISYPLDFYTLPVNSGFKNFQKEQNFPLQEFEARNEDIIYKTFKHG